MAVKAVSALWPHQQAALDFINAHPYTLWYGGMGLGKTLVALRWLEGIDGLRVAIAPKPVLSAWREDAERFGISVPVVILDKGSKASKQQKLNAAAATGGIVVVNYETAWRLAWDGLPVAAVVFDEAHKLGTYNSQQSLILAKVFANVPRKLAMTGTPWHDGYTKIYGMCRVLDPLIPDSPRAYPQARLFGHYDDFLDTYTHYRQDGYVKMIFGYKNTKTLAEKIAPFTIKQRTEDVIDLPELINRNYYADMSPQAKRVYKTLAEEGAVTTDDGQDILHGHILARMIRLQQLADSGVLVDEAGDVAETYSLAGRLAALDSILENLTDEPLVIFTRFKRDIEVLSAHVGERVGLLTGDTDTCDNWRAGKTRILLANISAGSVGVRLERARHVIFWSIGYSAGDYAQAIGRVRRAGQQASTVWAHNILTRDSVDVALQHAIMEKNDYQIALDGALA